MLPATSVIIALEKDPLLQPGGSRALVIKAFNMHVSLLVLFWGDLEKEKMCTNPLIVSQPDDSQLVLTSLFVQGILVCYLKFVQAERDEK